MTQPHQPTVRFDGTVNLPTILTVIVMFTTSVGFGVGMYNGIDSRIEKNTTDISYVRRDLTSLEQSQRSLDSRITDALQEIQRQNRQDFGDVRKILNQLLVSTGPHPTTADGRTWQK